MSKYLFAFHGGKMPDNPEAIQSIPANSQLSGYMLISSTSMDKAMAIADGCPILKNEGCIEVAELMSPP